MYDFIIVGQGICGSLLSWFLLKHNKKVLVFDQGNEQSSTHVASGILNPITGKRFVKTWMADELLPFAQQTYCEIETVLGKQFYKQQSIYKLFQSVKEQNDWSGRAADENYTRYLQNQEVVFLAESKMVNPFGTFEINGGGKLNTISFLKSYRAFLKNKSVLEERFFSETEALNSKIPVIFCDGFYASQNTFFSDLPWQVVKGEHLLVRIPDFYENKIISGDTTISPTEEKDVFYAGGTYEWNNTDPSTSKEGRDELERSLKKMLACDFEVLAHKAAIRPAVKDRRPFIGFYHEHSHVGIFNGMGTKGFSLSPYFANHFAEHLVNGKPLNSEVDIKRFLV